MTGPRPSYMTRDHVEPWVTELFLAKVVIDPGTGCHLWTGSRTGRNYGLFTPPGGKLHQVHRLAYTLFVGPIPDGHWVRHRCHSDDPTCVGVQCPHRPCINPDHLEAATAREVVMSGRAPTGANARKTACLRGHPYEPGSFRITSIGGRQCTVCIRDARRARRAAARAARAGGDRDA